MPICSATTQKGTPCTLWGTHNGLCGIHVKAQQRRENRAEEAITAITAITEITVPRNVLEVTTIQDPGPELVPVAVPEVIPQLRVIIPPPVQARRMAQRPALPTEGLDPALLEVASRERMAANRRDAQVQRLRHLMQFSPNHIIKFANEMADFWMANRIPGLDLIRAHCVLKHITNHHPSFETVLRTSLQVLFLSKDYDPQNRNYSEIRTEESAPLFAALAAALVPYMPIRLTHYITATDRYRQPLIQRMRADEAAERHRLEQEAARQAQHQENLRLRTVIFRRDPKNGVDLAQMATDQESVHRESVQTTTERAINILLVRPIPSDQDAYSEILAEFNTSTRVSWASENAKQVFLHEFAQDYLDGMAFGIRYGQVVDHVWAYIRGHEHRVDLVYRFLQELNDGRGSCVNGKMARLINTLQGYDDSVTMPPPRDVFQIQIERLRLRPVEERSSEARRLFEEYQIPGEEQGPWLEALDAT